MLNKEFFFDEAISLYIAKQPLHRIIFLHLKSIDCVFPFFNYLLSFWIKISDSIIWARVLPLIFGIFNIYLAYRIVAYLFNREIGLLTAFLVSTSEYYIFYSVEIRTYSLFTTLALLSWFYFLKFIKEPSFYKRFLYSFFTSLCIYSHLFGLFVLLTQSIILILNRKNYISNFRKWAWSAIPIMVIISPLILYYFYQYNNFYKIGSYVDYIPCFKYLISSLNIYSNHKYFLLLYIGLSIPIFIKKIKDLRIFNSFFKKIKLVFNRISTDFKLQFIFISFFLPLICICILSLGKIKFFSFYYSLPFFIFFYSIVSKIIIFYKDKIKNFILILTIIILSLNGLRFSLFTAFFNYKLEINKVCELIKRNLTRDDLVVIYDRYTFAIFGCLDVPIRIITNKEVLKDAKLYKADVFRNNFLTLDDYAVTEDYPLQIYSRLWLVYLENTDLSDIDWFFKNYSKSLSRIYKIDKYLVRLYNLKERF
ncbi:MAG: glycosyltransferase family 39 protein [Candidatus Omnitrophica bacterium]|nr:glycosyltransferase family 39 protein [Candidatus Omnitrophota bacterium]